LKTAGRGPAIFLGMDEDLKPVGMDSLYGAEA